MEPKVAAVGAGMDISKPSGNMVIDVGGGTTDVAILSLGGIVNSASIKVAGNVFDADIIKYIKDKYKLMIGDRTAEDWLQDFLIPLPFVLMKLRKHYVKVYI